MAASAVGYGCLKLSWQDASWEPTRGRHLVGGWDSARASEVGGPGCLVRGLSSSDADSNTVSCAGTDAAEAARTLLGWSFHVTVGLLTDALACAVRPETRVIPHSPTQSFA